jgi:hypothetical protein
VLWQHGQRTSPSFRIEPPDPEAGTVLEVAPGVEEAGEGPRMYLTGGDIRPTCPIWASLPFQGTNHVEYLEDYWLGRRQGCSKELISTG